MSPHWAQEKRRTCVPCSAGRPECEQRGCVCVLRSGVVLAGVCEEGVCGSEEEKGPGLLSLGASVATRAPSWGGQEWATRIFVSLLERGLRE